MLGCVGPLRQGRVLRVGHERSGGTRCEGGKAVEPARGRRGGDCPSLSECLGGRRRKRPPSQPHAEKPPLAVDPGARLAEAGCASSAFNVRSPCRVVVLPRNAPSNVSCAALVCARGGPASARSSTACCAA